MNIPPVLWLFCGLTALLCGQKSDNRLPRFEDYAVMETHQGPIARPKLVTPLQRRYRTVISQGVEKGWGVSRDGNGPEHPGPNFAGNMIVVQWGCGVPCLMMAMVDARTGTIHYLPLTYEGIGVRSFSLPFLISNMMPQVADFDFRADSRLMIVKATPKAAGNVSQSYTYYFLWKNDKWTLLRRTPLNTDEVE